jgi:hydrogenase maturation protease
LATTNFGSILVIGYGNSLRSDDGAGCRVSDIVATWDLPHVRSLTVHQLTPELAEPISQSELAIFIDAFVGDNELSSKRKKSTPVLQVQRIAVSKQLNSPALADLGHISDPRSLLLLAQQVYGEVPVAYSLLLPAVNWGFGEQLSAVTLKSIDQAVDFLRKLCTKLVSSNQC